MSKVYDVIIIGGGPAGLTAGIYAGRRGLKTIILSEALGGQMAMAHWVENYPGIDSMSGLELAEKMKKQAQKFGCEFKTEKVVGLDLKGEIKKVRTTEKEYSAKAVILATGAHSRKLEIEGEDKFIGRGVSYCATCDGPLFKGKKVAVVGGSDCAVNVAVYLSEVASETCLIHRRDRLRAEEANQKKLKKAKVKIILNSCIEKIQGDKFVKKIVIKDVNTDKRTELAIDGVFIEGGEIPTTEIVKAAGVDIDEKNFIKVNDKFETNIPGVFASGVVTGAFSQIVIATSQGAETATNVYLYLSGGFYGENKPSDYGGRK